MLVKPDGTIYMIDFEQAARDAKGDKAWDVAVFLYYSGHYLQPLYGNDKAESIAKAFINGYLKAGGRSRCHQESRSSQVHTDFQHIHNVEHHFSYFKCLQKNRSAEVKVHGKESDNINFLWRS